MTIQLDAQSETMIRNKVASGLYRDEAEVIREALDALEERERFLALKADIAAGFEQAERGELIEYTSELRDELIQSAIRRGAAGERPNVDA